MTPSAYRYSAHRAHLGLIPATGVGVRCTLSYFAASIPEGRSQLRRAVQTFDSVHEEQELLRGAHRRRSRDAGMQTTQSDASELLGVTEDDVLLQVVASVEREVCARHGVPATALFAEPTPRGVAVARSVIVHVLTSAKVMRLVKLATLARRYRRAPQTLRGEMLRHQSDPMAAGLFSIDLGGLLEARLGAHGRSSL